MPDFDAGVILGDIVEGLTKFSESIKVIADPIEAANKMIIPAVVVRVGFGAGGGTGARVGDEGEKGEEGGGGGGGGAVLLTPVFLIVDDEGERLLTVPSAASSATSIVDTIKGVVESIAGSHREEEAEEDEAAQAES